MHPVRIASLTILAIAASATLAAATTGCACSVTTYIQGPTKVVPGKTGAYQVMEQGGDRMQTPIEPAGGTWAWNVQGPVASTVTNKGGGKAEWTAPKTPGTYTIFAVGRGGTDNTKEDLGSARREVRTVVTVSADAAAPQEQASERPAAPPAGPVVKILDTGNTLGIRKGGSAPSFTLAKAAYISDVMTYHFLDGGGPTPGTVGLKSSSGKVFGPWQCKGLDGQGGVKNAFWVVSPKALVPAGTYTIVDSNPATWSTNDKAKGIGFTTVNVVYAK